MQEFKNVIKKKIIQIVSITPFTKNICARIIQNRKRKKYLNKYYNKNIILDNMIIFESYMGRQYSCSPKALYEEMLKDTKYSDFIKIWSFKNPEEHNDLLNNKNTYIVKYKSEDYYKAYSQAKYWITNSRIPNEIKKHNYQVYIQCWHGTPLKKLGFDIKNYTGTKTSTKDLYRNYRLDAERYTYIISPSNFFTEKITSAFGLRKIGKENIFIEKGYPRNDFLYTFTEEECENIKKKFNISKNKKVILYAPTWRENQHKPGVGYTYNLGVDFDLLKDKLEKDYVILFRAHYFISNQFNFEKYKGFIINASNYDDINHLYIISDMLITDYSSVFFDYANLKRPILFYMYDFEEYKNKMRDFYLSIDELPGPIIKDQKLLPSEIDKLINNFTYNNQYNEFNSKFNPYNTKCSRVILSECIK